MNRKLVQLATGVAATLVLATAPAAEARSPYCGITWGSQPESVGVGSLATVEDVRAGRHGCFDRLVFDLAGDIGGYFVSYVPQATMDGSGDPIPLRGRADLLVVAHAPAYDDNGASTIPREGSSEIVNVAGFRTFRQVAWGGTFEGSTTIGLGVRARLPFRVFALDGPGSGSRLVIDVAHRW